MQMAFMGWVEGATKKADAPASQSGCTLRPRRAWPGGLSPQGFQRFQGRT